jgi:hypothetical protein
MRDVSLKSAWGMLVAAALVVSPDVAVGQDGATRSTLDGVYAEEQAERGERLKATICDECHFDEDFTYILMGSWAEAPLNTLYDVISTQMPEDAPGSLAPGQYADVLAYILKMNGMPSGPKALEPTDDALRNIILRQKQ